MSDQLTLDQWLARIEAGHPTEIELGLGRVAEVARRLSIDLSPAKVITVAGTNGKGSTTALLDSVLRQGGYRTGVYTSPHFVRFNERIQLSGEQASDALICSAFSNIYQVVDDISLTYFEYGTLAALQIFQQAELDYVILEVGLGGRLDAVNIIDADLAILTSVALDHTDWLGDTLEAIGREKAGVFRTAKPALIGLQEPPDSVLDHAASIGAELYRRGVDFDLVDQGACWSWHGLDTQGESRVIDALPKPDLPLPNAVTVVQAISLIAPEISAAQIAQGLAGAKITGRLQREQLGKASMILDVAHNPEAAAYLATQVSDLGINGTIHLVLGMLADKDRERVIQALAPVVNEWHLVSLKGPRATDAESLNRILIKALGNQDARLHHNVASAFSYLIDQVDSSDLVLVCGSFLTVAEALEWLTEKA